MSDLPIYTRDEPPPRPFDGFGAVLVDKPGGITSFGVVKAVRRALNVPKVGHAGTLDPMASGLLVLLLGRNATRQQDRFMGLPKVYTGTVRLGQTTSTYDAESDIEVEADASGVTLADVEALVDQFSGDIQQAPPAFSALKRGGERLYKKARRGETVVVDARPVSVYELAWTNLRAGDAARTMDVDFRVHCSKGFYVRSLAFDVGAALGVGGHLTALRRESIGPFRVSEALSLDELTREAA